MNDDTKQTYNDLTMSVSLEHPLICCKFNYNSIITIGKCIMLIRSIRYSRLT